MPPIVVRVNMASNEIDTDNPYAPYRIPDDLMWQAQWQHSGRCWEWPMDDCRGRPEKMGKYQFWGEWKKLENRTIEISLPPSLKKLVHCSKLRTD